MDSKRGLILILVVLIVLLNIVNFSLLTTTSYTGKATSTNTGVVSLCLNSPPEITTVADQAATIGTAFTLQVTATDANNHTLTYFDNTSLFAISQTGYISFTPVAADAGNHSILVFVTDSSACTNNNASDTFFLNISEAAAAPTPTPEAPSAGAATGAGGGGGGMAVPTRETSFEVSDTLIKATIKENERLVKTITVTNTGETTLDFSIENSFPELVSIYPTQFTVTPGAVQTITLALNPYEEAVPDIYTGTITVIGTSEKKTLTKSIEIILEVETKIVRFDASVDLLDKTLFTRENLTAAITVVNIERAIPSTIRLIYDITDLKNKIYYGENETITLEEQASFTKIIPLPETVVPGEYVLAVKVLSAGSFATATELFTVEERPSALVGIATGISKKPAFILVIPFMFMLILIIVIILYILHRRTKKIRTRTIVRQERVIQPKIILKADAAPLRRQLSLLKESYEQGYIKKESYVQAKAELERKIQKMK